MEVYAKRAVDELERTMRAVGNGVTVALVNSNPVLTGRSRSNWIASHGRPSQAEVPSPAYDKSGQKAIKDAATVIAKFTVAKGDLFVTNNTPYIEQLNNGSSRQAPPGSMMPNALLIGRQIIKRRKINLGD